MGAEQIGILGSPAAADDPAAIGVEDHFSVDPAVPGEFEVQGRTWVFVPSEPLAPATLYTVSLTGTPGERDDLPPELGETVARVRDATDVPVAVGFGISTREQAAAVGEIADGVIVGSRVVRAMADGPAAVGDVGRDGRRPVNRPGETEQGRRLVRVRGDFTNVAALIGLVILVPAIVPGLDSLIGPP